MENELVSIIVPIYKVEKFLEECITSLINQTYKNIEILLVDDGSPDKCGSICDNYAKKDNRIRVFHIENSGVSVARNKGLEESIGNWIIFVDGDDYVENTMVENLYNAAIKNNCDIVFGNYNITTNKRYKIHKNV